MTQSDVSHPRETQPDTLLKVAELEQRLEALREAAEESCRTLAEENEGLAEEGDRLRAALEMRDRAATRAEERIAELETQVAYLSAHAEIEAKIGKRLLHFQEMAVTEEGAALEEMQNAASRIERSFQRQSDDIETRAARWQALSLFMVTALLTGNGRVSVTGKAVLHRAARALDASDLFDGAWYAETNSDVARAGIDPAEHFLRYGLREGRLPSPAFARQPAARRVAELSENGTFGTAARPLPATVAEVLSAEDVLPHRQLTQGARDEAIGLARAADRSVSVIVPTYNRAPTILRAVRSALEQSLPPAQVIVADDASEDNTLALLKETFAGEILSGQLLVLPCEKGGVCKMRNEALAAATGEVVAFLDSDNFWHPDHLLWAVAALEVGDRECVYTAANIHHLTEHWSRVDSQPYDRQQLLTQNFIDLNCFVHKIDLYRRHGGFDPSLTRLVDWDYIIRLTSGTAPLRVPVPTVEYFLDKEALSNISFVSSLQENAMRIQIKHREEMRAQGVLNANAEARLDAYEKGLPEEEKGTPPAAPSTRPAAANETVPALTPGGEMSRMPYFGGLTLFVVLPEGILPPPDLPLEFVRARFVHLHGEGRWTELSPEGRAPKPGTGGLPQGNFWCPDPRMPLPSAHQLASLVAATQLTRIDMAIASYSLDMPPLIALECFRNQVVLREGDVEDFAFGRSLRQDLLGKVLRLPQGLPGKSRESDLGVLLGRKVHFAEDGQCFGFGPDPQMPAFRRQRRLPVIPPVPGRTRVLVLAQKLAVGGVERNTIEVARQLARDHDCLYLTLEKIRPESGCLSHQAVEACINTLDLAEIGHHAIYPQLLRHLADTYAPDNLWICNGSMWLCAEAEEVREIFHGAGIVDQQVYDVDAGWIRRYGEKGIQSFDRFIAINRKIHQKFIRDLRMDPERIDLIYSAINAERFRAARAAGYDRAEQRRAYDLPQDKTILAFMGRLVDQKRPLDFLRIACDCARRPDLHFVLVGNGERAPEIEAFLEKEKPGNLTWLRNVADTTTFWPAVDGYLVTSEYEGLPIALIEAISLGVPVLATDVGDIRFVLERYEAGQVIDRIGAPEDFVAALPAFLDPLPARTSALAERGEEIIDFFSAETISRKFADSFAKAAARRGES